jgi:hypothetical protein
MLRVKDYYASGLATLIQQYPKNNVGEHQQQKDSADFHNRRVWPDFFEELV